MPKLNFSKTKFVLSCGTSWQLPKSTKPEISFVGRSNVGKSSLLNKLTNNSKLAKISSTPGKTTTINFFDADNVHLVDLPGYGYAARSNKELVRWQNLIEGYFNQDRYFSNVVCLVDIRHKPSKLDIGMISFIHQMQLPFIIALTKADKLSNQQAIKQSKIITTELGLDERVNVIITSSTKNKGINELKKSLEVAL